MPHLPLPSSQGSLLRASLEHDTLLPSKKVSELIIKTAKTKVPPGVHLASKTFTTETGENVITLLRINGAEKECDHLEHEWMHTVERTTVHAQEPMYERLENALKELNGLLKGTLISNAIKEIDAILVLCDTNGILHMSQAGRAEAYLMRKGSTVQITERAPTKSANQFLYISSGEIEKNDSVILSTERLLRSMTPAQLTQAARKHDETLDAIRDVLEREKEAAVLALLFTETSEEEETSREKALEESPAQREKPSLRRRKATSGRRLPQMPSIDVRKHTAFLVPSFEKAGALFRKVSKQFADDLQHPTRKHKAHLLLLACAIIMFVGIWSGFQVTTLSKKSQSRTEIRELVETISADIATAENRQLMGDTEAANALLNRAEVAARDVMQNEGGYYRTDALDLLDRIRAKRESINNIIRLSPTIVANLSSRNPAVSARGLIGIERGRLIVYDRQNLYSIIVNAVDEPQRLDGENLILNGTFFDRFDTTIFTTKENRLIELIEGQPTAMKTDDPAGWLSGPDIETYIRFLYILSPQNNQILKYERLSNRYSAPTEYNVNGNLEGGIDMTIDQSIYVLRKDGQGTVITKLFRGEDRPFTIRNLPEGALDTVTKIFKVRDRGNFYFLDPENARVIVTRTDDDPGESLYLKQYVLESEQIGILQDLYIDPEGTHLFVLDEKRLYSVNLQEG